MWDEGSVPTLNPPRLPAVVGRTGSRRTTVAVSRENALSPQPLKATAVSIKTIETADETLFLSWSCNLAIYLLL